MRTVIGRAELAATLAISGEPVRMVTKKIVTHGLRDGLLESNEFLPDKKAFGN